MRRFIIQERSASGNDSDFDGTNPELTDTYEVNGSLQDAIDRLADVADSYTGYRHRLLEVIPVSIQRGMDHAANELVAVNGDVRVTTTAK
jgi:hypothetical protein